MVQCFAEGQIILNICSNLGHVFVSLAGYDSIVLTKDISEIWEHFNTSTIKSNWAKNHKQLNYQMGCV